MALQRHLRNAPITEAIIDFRVKLPDPFDVNVFRGLKEQLHERFPKAEEARLFKGGFKVETGLTSQFSQDMGLHGFLFKSEDDLNVVQFRKDGFTFSRLKPYTSWEEVFPEAWRLWEIYREKSSPENLFRIAVRYINHLRLPLPFQQFSDYLEAPPNLPPDIPQNVSSFLTRQVIHDLDSGIAINLTQALEGSAADTQHAIIILDIDAYKSREYQPNDESVLLQEFEALHKMKNLIFFSSITEETAGLFE
jgi:uncharacterized protein (TIGR04255 family)